MKRWYAGQLYGKGLTILLVEFANRHDLKPAEILVVGSEGNNTKGWTLSFMYFAESELQ